MLRLNIQNETNQLISVLVGIANDFGGVPVLEGCYDPKSKNHVKAGTFPCENDCIRAMDDLVSVFQRYDITVYRPQNISRLNQIFARDIAFVIDNKLILPNIIEDRRQEVEAIYKVLDNIEISDKIRMPKDCRAEGGDVLLCNEYIFVGYSEREDFDKYIVSRTNRAGLNFLAENFPKKKVKGFELNKSDEDPKLNTLHLDCCFQPIGHNMAILYRNGFKNEADCNFLTNYFGPENIIEVSRDEMCNMNVNVFSISEKVVISDKSFIRLNAELRKRSFVVEEVSYSEIGKMSGLFRCSTMPLIRKS